MAAFAFDLSVGELWVNSNSLPKDAICKAGLTTMPMLRRKGALYLPMRWVIEEWEGPTELLSFMKECYSREMANLDKYREEQRNLMIWKQISNSLLINLAHVISLQVEGKKLLFVLVGQIEHAVEFETEEKAKQELEMYNEFLTGAVA